MLIPHKNTGFTLMEVMIGVFLSTVLMTGIVQLMGASVAAYRLQLSQSQLEESGRYARDVLMTHINTAGYRPWPWKDEMILPALTMESLNNHSAYGDQLGLQYFSQINCYGSHNPVLDEQGEPAFYLLQARFQVTKSSNLAMTCRYGPDATALITQMNNFGLVEGVESMQVLYAEDQDKDHIADRWVNAQSWHEEGDVVALKLGILLATKQTFNHVNHERFTMLDETYNPASDGKIRRPVNLTMAIRGRSR